MYAIYSCSRCHRSSKSNPSNPPQRSTTTTIMNEPRQFNLRKNMETIIKEMRRLASKGDMRVPGKFWEFADSGKSVGLVVQLLMLKLYDYPIVYRHYGSFSKISHLVHVYICSAFKITATIDCFFSM